MNCPCCGEDEIILYVKTEELEVKQMIPREEMPK